MSKIMLLGPAIAVVVMVGAFKPFPKADWVAGGVLLLMVVGAWWFA